MKHEDEEQDEPAVKLPLITISDQLAELWVNYGNAKTKDEKLKIREKYNPLAKEYNERVGWECLVYLSERSKVAAGEEPAKQPKPETKSAAPVSTSEPKAGSKIAEILKLHDAGKTNAEIIAAGYNKSTVARQVGEYKKRKLLNNGK